MPPGDRVPPHNLEAEESLLGAMLLSVEAAADGFESVTAEDFYKPAYGHVFTAMGRLYGRSEPTDAVTVAEELSQAGLLDTVGGPPALVALQSRTPAISNAGAYARIVRDHSLLRRVLWASNEIAELVYNSDTGVEDVAEIVDRAESLLFAVANTQRRRRAALINADLADWLELLESRLGHGELAGVATGWHALDEMLLGLHGGQLICCAARPAMGKSQWAGELALAASGQGHPVLFNSLEMSKSELIDRFMAAAASIELTTIRKANLSERDWGRLNNSIGQVAELPLYVNDDAGANLMSIRAEARRIAAAHGRIGLVIVDYLQLIEGIQRGRHDNREREVADVARGLKRLALEMDVPVVALAQLNRNLELRTDKRPKLADLRESGEIEQSSDVVVFLYRDEMYHPKTDDRGVAEVIVAKQRNGPMGTARLAYLARYGQFRNMAREDPM